MSKHRNLRESYDRCLTEGNIIPKEEINFKKIETLIENAKTNISSAKILSENISKKAKEWMNVYILWYDAVRILSKALVNVMRFDSENHLCLFSMLCVKFPELELDWYFFEKIRSKRNRVQYEGDSIIFEDFKGVELQFRVYADALFDELKKALNNYRTEP